MNWDKWDKEGVYAGIEAFILSTAILMGVVLLLAGKIWWFSFYCFAIWCGWKAIKWFEREWCDVDLPRGNESKWKNFYGDPDDENYEPNSYYTNQVKAAMKPGADEDPEVIRLRAKIKLHMKQQRKKNEKELDLEDDYRAHHFPKGW